MTIADLLDTALEVPIAPSFTRIGYTVRSHAEHWPAIESYDLAVSFDEPVHTGDTTADFQVNRRSSSCDEIGCVQPSNWS
jgi:hypothetical protein